MQIKRFEAKNMTSALRLIKAELGTDAVILSARSIKKRSGILGTLKYSGVEVTAASDTHIYPEEKSCGDLHTETANKPINPYCGNSPGPFSGYALARGGRTAPAKTFHNKRFESIAAGKKYFFGFYQQLISRGVDTVIAADLTESMKLIPNAIHRLANGEAEALIISLLEPMGLCTQPIQVGHIKPQPIVFIGSSGVGKTTAVAKLAAHFAVARKKAVALITFDDVRIGAPEQIRTYARIIGLQLEVVSNRSELKKHLKRFKDKDLVLIDTAGLNPKNSVQVKKLQHHFEKLPALQTQLVLSATTKESDLIDTIKRFEGFGRRRLLFSRLDETGAAGNLLNVLVRTRIPVSYFSVGQQIPDDLQAASLKNLVRVLMNEKMAPQLQMDVAANSEAAKRMARAKDSSAVNRQANFIANRNSEVYHVAGCKWTKKIKPENMITFESAAAAAHRNYLPCRNCNPDRGMQSDTRVFERDDQRKLNVSAY